MPFTKAYGPVSESTSAGAPKAGRSTSTWTIVLIAAAFPTRSVPVSV